MSYHYHYPANAGCLLSLGTSTSPNYMTPVVQVHALPTNAPAYSAVQTNY